MANDGLTYTPVPETEHDMVKSYAAFRHIKIPDAYKLVINEGLRALDFDLPNK